MNTLFPEIARPSQVRDTNLMQFLTPEWAACALVEEFFPDLGENDVVLEPSCGRGAFLKAIPDHVGAVGVEIDADLAREAIENSGRPVIVGDFRTVEIPYKPTQIIGNPPFNLALIEAFLNRAHELLPDRGRCGLLLPSYAIQTPSRVLNWAKRWSLQNSVIPRTLFPRMIRPLIFVQFTKGTPRLMCGFSLYRESHEVNQLSAQAKLLLIHGKPKMNCWRAVVEWALRKLGGRAALSDIYAVVEPNRPSETNRFWEAKVRQTLQRHFTPAGEKGVWAL